MYLKAINKDNRDLEEVVSLLINSKDLEIIQDVSYRKKIQIQRIKGEMRKYLNRPRMWAMQIEYLREQIKKLEDA